MIKNITGNFHVSRGQSRSQRISPRQSKMEIMNPRHAIRAILLILASVGCLHAQAIRYESVAQVTNGQCNPGSLCPLLAVPGATMQVYTNANLTTPAITYTDATGTTPCPDFAQMTLPGQFACTSASDIAGNLGVWIGSGTFYYTLVYPVSAGGGTHGPYAFTAGVSGSTVAGSDTMVQYNRMGAAGADAGIEWNYTSGILNLKSLVSNGLILNSAASTQAGITISDNGTPKWSIQKNSAGQFSIFDNVANQAIFSVGSGGGQSITISATSGTVNFAGNAGTPSIVSTGNAFIQSTGGFLSVANSWQGINSAVDGALLRGYGVAQNNTVTAGGYIDIAPITYNPYLGSTCHDLNDNIVGQPLPLPGLSNFGTNDAILWVSPSPQMPPNGSCGVPLPVNPGIYGLNLNSYFFARGGLATDSPAYNAINTIYISGGNPSGGVTAGVLIAGTLYPAGTVTTTGTLVSATYLGGYTVIGHSAGVPAAGTISSTVNPFPQGAGLEQGAMYWDDLSNCVNVFNGSTWACLAGGGGGGTPGGATTNVQYNNTGAFGGSANFTWNNSSRLLTVTSSSSSNAGIAVATGFIQSDGGFLGTGATCTSFQCIQAPAGGITGLSLVATKYIQIGTSNGVPALTTGQGSFAAGGLYWDTGTLCSGSPGLQVYNGATWSCLTSGSGSPGGANTNVQFNSSGSFGGVATFTWNNTNRLLTITSSAAGNPAILASVGFIQADAGFLATAATCTSFQCIQAPAGGMEALSLLAVNYTQTGSYAGAAPTLTTGQGSFAVGAMAWSTTNNCETVFTNLSAWTCLAGGGGGTPGGANTSVQFNNSGSFGGSSNLVWNNTSRLLAVFSASSSNAAILASTGFIQSDAGFLASPGCANFNCVQTQGGGMLAKSFTAINYIQTGQSASTPALTSGDSFNAGAMFYNTTAACEQVYNGFTFSCIGGGGAVSSINGLTGAITLAGTTNQIAITPAGTTLTFSLAATVATGGYNATNVGASVTFQNSSGNFQVNGNGVISTAGSITTQGGLNVTTTTAVTSIQTGGGADLCNFSACAGGVALQVNGANVLTIAGGAISEAISGTYNSTGSGITFQNSSGNFQVNSSGAESIAGVFTTAGGVNVITTTSGSSIQSVGGANLCNAGTCSSGNALTIDGTPVITVSAGTASLSIAGTAVFGSAVTFNGGFVAGTGTNSSVHIGTGNFYDRTVGASSGVSCASVADGWMAVTSDDYVAVCIGGSRFRALLSSY